MSNKRCDLHIHSVFSDSDATMDEIFSMAKDKNLACISVTDHDTLLGIEEAQALSKEYDVELINGIEFSAKNGDSEVHVLGYFVDPFNKQLSDALCNIRELRFERLMLMVDKMNALGFSLDKEEIILKIKGNIPTRLHLGLYLLEKGIVSSLIDAFRRYLSPGKPAYVSHFKYSVEDVIGFIKGAGGLAFLAHPHLLSNKEWLDEFISLGLDGLEINYPGLSEKRKEYYKNKASKFNLLYSGGSDAHGSYKEFTQVGGVTIPYEWVEQMKSRLTKVPNSA